MNLSDFMWFGRPKAKKNVALLSFVFKRKVIFISNIQSPKVHLILYSLLRSVEEKYGFQQLMFFIITITFIIIIIINVVIVVVVDDDDLC